MRARTVYTCWLASKRTTESTAHKQTDARHNVSRQLMHSPYSSDLVDPAAKISDDRMKMPPRNEPQPQPHARCAWRPRSVSVRHSLPVHCCVCERLTGCTLRADRRPPISRVLSPVWLVDQPCAQCRLTPIKRHGCCTVPAQGRCVQSRGPRAVPSSEFGAVQAVQGA